MAQRGSNLPDVTGLVSRQWVPRRGGWEAPRGPRAQAAGALWSCSPHLPPLSLYCYLGLPAWFCFCEAVEGPKSSSDQLMPLPTFNASHHPGNRPSVSPHHMGLLASTYLFQLHSSLLPINSELQPLLFPFDWCCFSCLGHSSLTPLSKLLHIICYPVQHPTTLPYLIQQI